MPKVILPNIRSDNRPHVPVNYAKVNCNFPATPVNDKRKKVGRILHFLLLRSVNVLVFDLVVLKVLVNASLYQ